MNTNAKTFLIHTFARLKSARARTPIQSVLSPTAPGEQGEGWGGSGAPPVLNREAP
jgi:hypothetical protein